MTRRRSRRRPPRGRAVRLSHDDLWGGWDSGGEVNDPAKEHVKPPCILGHDQGVLRALSVSLQDGEEYNHNLSLDDAKSVRVAPSGTVEGDSATFYVPLNRGELTRVEQMSHVGESVEAVYYPSEEEVSVRRWGLKGRFNEDGVDSVTCVLDRKARIGEVDPVRMPKGVREIPVTGDMVLVDSRRPVLEDPGMPDALASEVAPDEGEDPEFAGRVKELVESAGLRVSVAGGGDGGDAPRFKARFLKRNMGFGVYTDELSLTPFDDEDAERILGVHADSKEDNSTLRTTMTPSGITFDKSWRHGEKEDDMYFSGVSVTMPFSRRDAGEFTVAVGDDMDEAHISYQVTGRDTGNVSITRPDGIEYDVEIVSARSREVRVMLNEDGAYEQLDTDGLSRFVADTVEIRRGMHAEMSRVEGLTHVFRHLFEDVAAPTVKETIPAVSADAAVGEPLNPAKHWNENTYGRHPDANVRSLLPEKLKITPPYPTDLTVDNQPLGWRAVYDPDEWYKPPEDDPFDILGGGSFPQGFETYQRMGLFAASHKFTEDVLCGRRRGVILQPLSAGYHGLGVNVNYDGQRLHHGGMMSQRDQTHYIQTNLMRGGCTCYLSDGHGKVQEFVFYAATTPLDDLAITETYVSPEYQKQSGVKLRKLRDSHDGPIYEVAQGDEGEVMPQPVGDEDAGKNIRVRGATIPGLDESTSNKLLQDFVLGRLYHPFGPGNVLVGRGGMVSSLQHWNRESVINSADTATAYAVPPEMEEQFRKALRLGFIERD